MPTLHVIRRADDLLAVDAAGHGDPRGTILLIHDGVRAVVPGSSSGRCPVYAAAHDVQARGVKTDYPLITTAEICRLIVEHERVIVW